MRSARTLQLACLTWIAAVWCSAHLFAGAPQSSAAVPQLKLDTGKEIFEAACIGCHGPGATGQPPDTLGFEPPATFPDFSDLEFRFAQTGEVIGIYTPGRWGMFPGGYRQVPWEGHFRDYRERDGVVVPTEGNVGWYVDDEWRAVWKGTVNEFELQTGHTRTGLD
jgi:hypothetical protein